MAFSPVVSNQVRRIVGDPAIAVVGEPYVEPAATSFEQIKLSSCMQRILEALRIIRAVTLAGNNLLSRYNTENSPSKGRKSLP